MPIAVPENLRLAALDRCGILGTPPDPHFDRITRLAAQFFGAPMAAISFVAHDRIWFKSTCGFGESQLARSASFCSHTIGCPEALVVPDATADERFAGLALVAGHPRVRFYAGVPVVTTEGFAVGAVAVMDTRPRGPLSESEIFALHDFSALSSRELNSRSSAGAASHNALPPAVGHGGEASSILSTIVQSAEDSIISVDLNGVILTWNPGAERLYGYSAAEVRGRSIDVIIPPDRLEEARDTIREARQGQSTLRRETVRIGKDGTRRFVSLSVAPVKGADGKPVAVAGIAHDITPLKLAEAARLDTEDRLQLAEEAAGLGIWDWSLPSGSITRSEQSCRLWGLPTSQTTMSYVQWLSTVHPEDLDRVRAYHVDLLRGAGRGEAEFRIIWPDGSVRWVVSKAKMYANAAGEAARVSGVNLDVTPLREAEQARRESEQRYSDLFRTMSQSVSYLDAEGRISQEQLRQLAARVESAREEERVRISREVHDEFGQMLSLLKLDLETLASLHRPRRAGERGEFDKRVAALVRGIDLSMNTVRRIAAELRPAVFEDLGLAAALNWQLKEFESRTGIRCRRRGLSHSAGLAAEPSLAVFRIFQEILTNVIRHAHATTLAVAVRTDRDWFTLRVSDNGKGFDPKLLSPSLSLGLLSMRERAGLHGGTVEWSGCRNGGTTVTIRLPRAGNSAPAIRATDEHG